METEDEIRILQRRMMVMEEVIHSVFQLIVAHNPDMRDAVMAKMAEIVEHFQGSSRAGQAEKETSPAGPSRSNLFVVK